MRLRLLAFVAALLVATFLGGEARADSFPVGVKEEPGSFSGVYPGSDAGSCCWLAPQAEISIDVPPGHASAVVVKLIIPDYALPAGKSESVAIRVDDGSPAVTCCLQRGYHELRAPLPPSHGAHVRVRIKPSNVFVPAQIGLNGDTRRLTLLLRGVEIIGGGAPWWEYAIFALALLVAGALTKVRPVFGACLLLLTAPLTVAVPLGLTSVSLATAVLVGCVLGLAAARTWRVEQVHPAFALFVASLFLFMLTLMVAQAVAVSPLGGRELWKATQALVTLLAAYAAYCADPDTRALYASVALLTLVAAVSAFAQVSGAAPETIIVLGRHLPRTGGLFDGPNQLCAVLGMLLPLLMAGLLNLRGALRVAGAIAFVAGMIAALLTFSRGGLLGLGLALVIVAVLLRQPQRRTLVAGVAGVLFAALFALSLLAFAGSPAAPQAIFGAPQAFNGGLGTRTTLYHDAYLLWRTSPLVGIGPGNFELRAGTVGLPGIQTHANSAYFQALCETGIFGLAAFALLTWLPLRTFFRNAADPMVAALFAAAAGLAVHQIVDNLLFYPKVLGVWFALLGIGFALVNRSRLTAIAQRKSDRPPHG